MNDTDKLWPSDRPGAVTTWIEYVTEPMGDDDLPRRYRVNASFLLSNWHCVFGQGCPSIMITGINYDTGCCQIGVHIGEDEVDRIRAVTEQLTPEDADNYSSIKARGAYYKEKGDVDEGSEYHTRVINGACIYSNKNTENGPAGCAFNRLARRTGSSVIDLKPNICWQIPIAVTEEVEDDTGVTVVTVTYTAGRMWGNIHRGSFQHLAWWCTESPIAYQGKKELVLCRYQDELRALLGDAGYEIMRSMLLSKCAVTHSMPADTKFVVTDADTIEQINHARLSDWSMRGPTDEVNQRKLRRSTDFLPPVTVVGGVEEVANEAVVIPPGNGPEDPGVPQVVFQDGNPRNSE